MDKINMKKILIILIFIIFPIVVNFCKLTTPKYQVEYQVKPELKGIEKELEEAGEVLTKRDKERGNKMAKKYHG